MDVNSSPETRLPEIKEHPTPAKGLTIRKPSDTDGELKIDEKAASLVLHTPSTPRIDISRASSSSHHDDSRDSSPENVFDQVVNKTPSQKITYPEHKFKWNIFSYLKVGTGTLQESCLGGFREDGALELRSSTEELYFMEPEAKSRQDQVGQLPPTQVL